MEFNLGSQFSREFTFEETTIIRDLGQLLNKYFISKSYGEIEKIYCGFICVSKGFEPFFMARPLKILKKEPAIEYEIKIEFESFFKSDSKERVRILCHNFLTQSRIILNDKKVKNFDLDFFLNDLNSFFQEKDLL